MDVIQTRSSPAQASLDAHDKRKRVLHTAWNTFADCRLELCDYQNRGCKLGQCWVRVVVNIHLGDVARRINVSN